MSVTVDLSCPLETSHPDNAGILLAFLNLPGMSGGARWLDATGRTSGGTLSSTGLTLPRWEPGGLRFDGSTQSVTGGQFATTSVTNWSAAVTLQTDNSDTRVALTVTDQADGWIGTLGGQGWLVSSSSNNFLTGGTPQNNIPQRVAGDYVNGILSLYVNGVRIATGARAGGTRATSIVLGRYATGGFFFRGLIGNPRIRSGIPDRDWAARDYEWTLNPSRDPRLRRLSGTAYFTPMSSAPMAGTYLPGFVGIAPGW